MRRKIILSLFALFLINAFGAIIATVYIKNTTDELNRLITLHQVENLRRALVISIQTVQSDLYTVHTPLGHKIDSIVNNVTNLEEAARECSSCHHPPEITASIHDMQSLIKEYETSLSYYITASANLEMINNFKLDAASIGNKLITDTENMSFAASRKLGKMTKKAMVKINNAKKILSFTLMVVFFLGLGVAVYLTRAVTQPVNELVKATRKIAAGYLGYTVSYIDKTEFGELAANFNTMSVALKEGYEKLQGEITERKQAEEALRESEERYALAARGANDGLWDWNLKTNEIYFSPRWKSMLGYEENEIGDEPEEWFKRVHHDDRAWIEVQIAAHIEGHTPQLEIEYRILHNDGTYRWMLNRGLAVRDSSGKACRMAGSQTDITERKLAEKQLLYDALHDSLTGLPNRVLFMDRLRHVIQRTKRRNKYLFAVLFIDMDRFKVVNDSLGHLIGDQLLIGVAQRLEECLRPGDTVARLGGDEFAILLEDVKNVGDATVIADRIQEKLTLPFNLSGNEIFITASIGIAFSKAGDDRPEHLLRNSDIAMYHAKTKGRDRYEVFEIGMHENIVARLQLETDLRRAVENKEFLLHYQPIVSLKTNRLVGFEALVRWHHPKRGIVYPQEFIPLAEETGLIVPIGQWVLNEACHHMQLWQEQFSVNPPLAISINISIKQFSPPLVEQIKEILKETSLDPSSIILEITESMIMENTESVTDLFRQLKDMNIQLHIDDFGTGYSSLSYLSRFPINALKIDRSFVKIMGANGENSNIVSAIMTLANNLNIDVIVEGVETSEQLEKFKTLNCEYFQGFLFSEPLDSGGVEALLAIIKADYEKV